MHNIQQLKVNGRSVLHRPAEDRASPVATLVLLHGYGADEYDLMGLASYFRADIQVLSIRGGSVTPYGGASWFDIDMLADGSLKFNIEQAKVATEAVIEIIHMMQYDGTIPAEKIILGGFSQGATISNLVTIKEASLLKGLLVMSGRLPEDIETLAGDKARFADLQIFAGHGTHDNVIPIRFGHDIVSFWGPIANLEHHEYPMGHEISQDELSHILRWMEGILTQN